MKKILFSLLLFVLSIISFGICDNVSNYLDIVYSGSNSVGTSYTNVFNYGDNGAGTYCIKFMSSSPQQLVMGFANGGTATPSNLYTLYSDQYDNWICLYGNKPYLNIKPNSNLTYSFQVFILSDFLNSSVGVDCSVYEDALNSCSSSYNQCIIDYGNCSSSLNYCYYDLGNCRAGVCSGDISTNLFINDIQYPANSNLYINVPLEFDYNYDYSGDNSTIDIEYKVDTDYIEGIINIQNTIPTKDNLNQIVSGLIPLFVPGLVIILFIYFVFKLLKKIF